MPNDKEYINGDAYPNADAYAYNEECVRNTPMMIMLRHTPMLLHTHMTKSLLTLMHIPPTQIYTIYDKEYTNAEAYHNAEAYSNVIH